MGDTRLAYPYFHIDSTYLQGYMTSLMVLSGILNDYYGLFHLIWWGYIMAIPLCAETSDRVVWRDTSHSSFATKSAWQLVQSVDNLRILID